MTPFDRIAGAIEHLALAPERVSLEAAARDAGLSPFHFQRTFHRLVGVTPQRFQQVLRLEGAREALRRSRSVLEAAWDGGLSGPGRLHDALVRLEAMTPGEFKAGPALRWTEVETPLGPLAIAATARGLSGASFDGERGLLERWPNARLTRDDAALRKTAQALHRAFSRGHLAEPLTVVVPGTALQLAVWRALLEIPEGAVVTYTQLAVRCGRPTASRAVANAVGANPVAWLIPCHRVIRATGALGGYRWGLARKAALLAREASAEG